MAETSRNKLQGEGPTGSEEEDCICGLLSIWELDFGKRHV